MRLSVFDGIRGHLLVGMMIAHLGFSAGMAVLLNFHHYRIISLYDAEFFVTISGLLIGILLARKNGDLRYFLRFSGRRLKTIYGYYLLSAIPYLVIAIGQSAGLTDIVHAMLRVLVMAQGGYYSDILPIYFYAFVLLAIVYTVAVKAGWIVGLCVSGVIYCLSQILLQSGFFGLSSGFVVFNIAAWQFLFVLSFFIGLRSDSLLKWIREKADFQRLAVFALCVIVFALTRKAADIGYPYYDGSASPSVRFNLHPFYLAAIVFFSAGFSIIMIAPPTILRWLQRLVSAYFSLGILQNVGRYSIQMFVLHVFLLAGFRAWSPDLTLSQRWTLAIAMLVFFVAAPNLHVLINQARLQRRSSQKNPIS